MSIINSIKNNSGDWILSVAVFIQPLLVLLQSVLMYYFGMQLEETTKYRVILTAGIMLIAMGVAFFRKPLLFLGTFLIIGFVVAFTFLFFPENREVIREEGFRFLLPVVVPSFIVVLSIKNIDVIRQAMTLISWIAVIEVFFVMASFLMGFYVFDIYNMAFSYACLFPMIVLYSQKRFISVLISIVLFFVVLALGSRGGALIFVAFVALDMLRKGGKMRIIVILLTVLAILAVPIFVKELEGLGINSRALSFMANGELLDASNREYTYQTTISSILNNPITGLGLYGDRVLLGGYCHNIFLEILLDYGIVLGAFFILLLFFCIIKALIATRRTQSYDIILILIFTGLLPLLASGSYLQDTTFATLVGYCIWCIRHRYVKSREPVL